jgi:hypothetical protein
MSDTNPAALTATEKTKQALGQAAPWAFFLAIMGYIGSGVLALAGLLMLVLGGFFSSLSEFGGAMTMIWPILGVCYMGLGLLSFFPTLMLNRIASRSKAYGLSGGPADLEGVAVNVKSLAKYWGICTIVLLAVYVIAIVGLVIALLAMPHRF